MRYALRIILWFILGILAPIGIVIGVILAVAAWTPWHTVMWSVGISMVTMLVLITGVMGVTQSCLFLTRVAHRLRYGQTSQYKECYVTTKIVVP